MCVSMCGLCVKCIRLAIYIYVFVQIVKILIITVYAIRLMCIRVMSDAPHTTDLNVIHLRVS